MNELQCLKEQLERHQVGTVLLNEPLSKHTTIKTGGPADLLVQPNDKEGLLKTIELVDASGLPRRVIGRGSNLLVKDGGIRGVVVKLGKGMDWLHIEDNM